ncbi:MAG TPA: hypothetical protein VFJ85_07695 [Acidimicrobiales bacterium]|nr:hypothetical protein [Acidimicrobiales bacterium]
MTEKAATENGRNSGASKQCAGGGGGSSRISLLLC